MSERFVKGKRRTETPRLKDLHVVEPARDPSEGRGEAGRFGAGNRHGVGQGIKALIRRGLGDPENPATAELVREATRLYLHLLRALPADDTAVRQLTASQARHAVLATFFANEAARVGLATKEGLALAEAARSHDTTAQRLSVTAYDRATRAAAARPKNPLADLEARMAAARRLALVTSAETTAGDESAPDGQPDGSTPGSAS